MLYFDNDIINELGFSWHETIDEIKKAITCMYLEEWAQPIKPYLRYGNNENRIIAMPAYVGGEIDVSGIKWISSFPQNINKGIPRAHCVVVLNDSQTGVPKSILNASLVSIIRTASVSGVVIDAYIKSKNVENINIGIIGWGPIGQYHYKMIKELLGNRINKIYIFDIRKIDVNDMDDRIEIVDSWEKAYLNADIFITCTVSNERYINLKPKKGALLLNVSLRDFKSNFYHYVKNNIIVDDWDEVCRENTDVEQMHKIFGLSKEKTHNLIDVLFKDFFTHIENDPIMFNPMGMGIFDLAIANYFYKKGLENNLGVIL